MLKPLSLMMVVLTFLMFTLPNFVLAQESEEAIEAESETQPTDVEESSSEDVKTIKSEEMTEVEDETQHLESEANLSDDDTAIEKSGWNCIWCGEKNDEDAKYCAKCGIDREQGESEWWDNYGKVLIIGVIVGIPILLLIIEAKN